MRAAHNMIRAAVVGLACAVSVPSQAAEGAAAFAEFSAEQVSRFNFNVYIPLNYVVTCGDDGTGTGRSYSLEVGEERASGEWTEYYGFYLDGYEFRDGEWRFARRHYRTIGRRTGGQLTTFPFPEPLG